MTYCYTTDSWLFCFISWYTFGPLTARGKNNSETGLLKTDGMVGKWVKGNIMMDIYSASMWYSSVRKKMNGKYIIVEACWFCLITAIWRSCKPFSQWQRSFHTKMRSHWLKLLQQRHITVVRQCPEKILIEAVQTSPATLCQQQYFSGF